MPRKFALLAATIVGVSLALTGLAIAADEDSPLHKQMEAINKHMATIRKSANTPAAWAKSDSSAKVAKSAAEVSKISKEAKKDKTSAEKAKKPQADWEKFSDDTIKAADALVALASKPGTKQPDAKAAYLSLNKTCTECHTVYRVEEEK